MVNVGGLTLCRQIIDRMLKGKIQMGTPGQSLACWHSDELAECSGHDHIWGWSICSTEVLFGFCCKLDDNILHKMLHMCLLDERASAPAWTEPTSLKQGLRLLSSAIICVIQCVFETEEKVHHSGCLFFDGS